MSEDLTPVFQIQRVYLKDLSLEQPNSPAILTSQEPVSYTHLTLPTKRIV